MTMLSALHVAALAPLNLPGNYKLAAAIIVGMVAGFLLVKSDLIWRKSILDFLTLKNGRIIKTVFLILFAGTLLFFWARRSGMVTVHTAPAYFWASLVGGVISGVGLVCCCSTPVTAIPLLGTGRLYALWTLLGMLLALPAVQLVAGFLRKSIYSWGEEMSSPSEPPVFWAVNNPALFIAAGTLLMIILVHFTVGDKEEGGGKG